MADHIQDITAAATTLAANKTKAAAKSTLIAQADTVLGELNEAVLSPEDSAKLARLNQLNRDIAAP